MIDILDCASVGECPLSAAGLCLFGGDPPGDFLDQMLCVLDDLGHCACA